MPDLVLDYHRLKIPIDHLDLSITRAKLEYPTVDVSFAYLTAIDRVVIPAVSGFITPFVQTVDVFADKGMRYNACGNRSRCHGRVSGSNYYTQAHDYGLATQDHHISKCVGGTETRMAYEALDLDGNTTYYYIFSISGSTFKGFRNDLTTPKLSATDTTIASGCWSPAMGWNGSAGAEVNLTTRLVAPSTSSPPAQTILELNVEGSGKPEDPFRPAMSKNLVPISQLTGLPDFLYRDAKKYEILKAKGFTDDEIIYLISDKIQTHVDLDSVTWGAFEFHPDKAPTAIITVIADNPYKSAILRQINFARRKNLRVFSPPRDYSEAVELYNQLERDYTHWLAGKDNFAYQTLGWEILDWMQNIDFYHGELLDHMTHYNQLKQVPDKEITNRLNELIDKLSRETTLTDEREKHIAKAKEVLKKGW